MTAYSKRMPFGSPGVVTRMNGGATIEAFVGNTSLPFPAYGLFAKVVSGKIVPIAASDAATVIKGLLAKPFPTTDYSYPNATFSGGTPPSGGILPVLLRGYMTVLNRFGTPAVGSPVYVRTAATAGNRVLGGIEGTSDSGNNVVVPNAFFTSAADADGNVEVAFNL